MGRLKIAPSIMCADFMHLENDIRLFEREKIGYLHMDIMDGHYVPNFTLGPGFCSVLAASSSIPLDIHLMIEDVDRYIPQFAAYPGAVVSFHPEVSYHPLRSIDLIRKSGARAGIAIEPAMTVESVAEMLPDVDLVCVMTVNPGYSGQRLVPQTMDKLRALSRHIREKGYDIEVEVDGNVSWANIPRMLDAGAEVFVAGTSSLFEKGTRLTETIARFRGMLEAFEGRKA